MAIEANQQTELTVEKQEIPTGADRVIKVSQIIIDLDSGLGRTQIKEKYSFSGAELKVLFQHPALKNRRPKRALTKITFTLVDDVTSSEDTESDDAEDTNFDNFEIIN